MPHLGLRHRTTQFGLGKQARALDAMPPGIEIEEAGIVEDAGAAMAEMPGEDRGVEVGIAQNRHRGVVIGAQPSPAANGVEGPHMGIAHRLWLIGPDVDVGPRRQRRHRAPCIVGNTGTVRRKGRDQRDHRAPCRHGLPCPAGMPRHPQLERCGKPLPDARGGESLWRRSLRRDEPLPCPGIDHHGPEPGGKIVGSLGIEARGRIGDKLAVAGDVGGDHRRAAGHRLDHRHGKTLRPRGDDGRHRMPVPAGKLGVADMVEELKPDRPAAGPGYRPCDAGSPTIGIAAGDHQSGIGAPGP